MTVELALSDVKTMNTNGAIQTIAITMSATQRVTRIGSNSIEAGLSEGSRKAVHGLVSLCVRDQRK